MKRSLILLLFLPLAELYAQSPTPAPTPPLPPLIKRAPEKVQWVIVYKAEGAMPKSAGAQKQPGKPAEVPVVKKLVFKTNGIILERTLSENGVTLDTWYVSPGLAVTSVQGREWTLSPVNPPGFETADYTKQDFAGFDWITPQNFIGVTQINGRRCLAFQDRVVTIEQSELQAIQNDINRDFSWTSSSNGDSNAKSSRRIFNIENYKNPVVAYIDDETRLPIALVCKTPKGTTTRTFEFQAAPAPLKLPPEAQAALKGNVERQRRLSVSRAPI